MIPVVEKIPLNFHLTALLLASDEDKYSIGKIAIACEAAALSECRLESTLDNVVIPLVFLAFLKLIQNPELP